MEKEKKKPDALVWDAEEGYNAALLPYATNIGAPAIKKEDIDPWKGRGISKVNHSLQTKFEELKSQYLKMVEDFKWNEIVYSSKFNFEPIVGETYYLYYDKKMEPFLSMIKPTEWGMELIGEFTLDTELKWNKR